MIASQIAHVSHALQDFFGTAPAASAQTPASDQPVEIPSRRTRTSRTFLLANGNYEAQLYPGSIHYQDAAGAWAPIDNTLVAATTPGYAFANKANAYSVEFPASLGGAPIKIGAGAASMSFSLLGSAAASGTASGSSISYPNALPGVSSSYLATNDSLKESITLADASAISAPFSVPARANSRIRKRRTLN